MDLIYGPVQSLRYGSTLGINLLGSEKVCSYNCIYCHLGPTTMTMNKMRKDHEFPTLAQITTAFRKYIQKSVRSDVVVISGNGEPTLHPQFDEVAQLLVELRDAHIPGTKIVILSNGANLETKRVISGMNLLDERVIKIDAGNDHIMQMVNAPLVRMNMEKFLVGIRKLKNCVGQSLFVDGPHKNYLPEMIDDWTEVLGMIKPESVQICTVTRPSFNPEVRAVDDDTLYGISYKLKKRTGLEGHVFVNKKT
jgi:wyosine [tRNA(Phe)-imidazoG37] synthetase (radical SAM superfamily)